jgi:hypothetical protein
MREPTPTFMNRLCVECGRVSRESERGWTARLTIDELEKVVIFCPWCDERGLRGSYPWASRSSVSAWFAIRVGLHNYGFYSFHPPALG